MPIVARGESPITTKSTMTQFNVRMDSSLKKAGDEGFRSIGFTPSEVVRLVWQRATQSPDGPAEVLEFIRLQEHDDGLEKAEEERRRRMELARRGPQIVENFYRERGLSLQRNGPRLTDKEQQELDDELRLQHFEEKYGPICM